MQQAVGAGGEVHESAERRGLDDLAVVGFAGLGHVRVGNLVDDGLGLLSSLATLGGDEDGTVILDGNFSAGVFLNLVDHLALRADDFADLLNRDGGGDDARSELAHLGRAVDALVDDLENRGAGFLSLLQSGGQDVGGDAVELGVELQGGDELGSTGHLEVHVAEGILGTQNIGEGLEDVLAINVAGHEAHGDAGNRSLQRHAGSQKAQRGGAHGTHRSGTVGTDGLGDLSDGVGELFAARQHRHESLLGEGAVADFAALRGTDAAGLTSGVRRHLVVVHVTLGLRTGQRVDLLLHLEHVQRGDAQNLGLATLEQGGTVHARHNVHLGGQGADVAQATAVDAVVLGQDAATHNLALQFLEGVTEFLVLLGIVHIGELVREHLAHVLLDLMDAILTRQLLGDGERLVQILVSDLVDAGVQLVGVLREELEFLGLLGGDLLELVLSLANHLDERLGGLKTTGNDFLIGLGLTLVVDEVPGVLAGTGLDHGDGNITVLDHAASDHNLEHGALTLAPTREGNPLAINQRQTHTGDRAFERQTGNHGGSGSGVQGDDIVSVIRVHGEHGLDDLHFVAQGVREQRAQRAVDDAAGEDGLGARAAFTAEERARNLAGSVHLLFNINGQREEVVVLLRAGTGGGGGQNHGIVVEVGGHSAIGLLGEAAGLEAQRALTKRSIVDYGLNGLDFGTLHRVPPSLIFYLFLHTVLRFGDSLEPQLSSSADVTYLVSTGPLAVVPRVNPFIRVLLSALPAGLSSNPLAVVAVGWRYVKRPSTILGTRAEVFNYRRRPRRSMRER